MIAPDCPTDTYRSRHASTRPLVLKKIIFYSGMLKIEEYSVIISLFERQLLKF